MSDESIREIRERSEREYRELVERIANRVWEIMKQNARHDKERKCSDRSNKG